MGNSPEIIHFETWVWYRSWTWKALWTQGLISGRILTYFYRYWPIDTCKKNSDRKYIQWKDIYNFSTLISQQSFNFSTYLLVVLTLRLDHLQIGLKPNQIKQYIFPW